MKPTLPSYVTRTVFPYQLDIGGVKPGDFFLVEGTDWQSKLIKFGQSLRYHGSKDTFYTHCGMFINTDGGIVEADFQGVKTNIISKYERLQKKIVYLNITDEDRSQMLLFAKSCVNEGYGFLTILSIGWSLLTGSKFSIGLSGEEICSGLVARSLERTSYIPNNDASHITPADLAEQFVDIVDKNSTGQ